MTPILDESMSSEFCLELDVVTRLCQCIDSPRALTVYLLLTHGEWQQYLDLTIDPGQYENVSNFADDYLVTEVLRKSPNIPLGIDREAVARSAFYEAEEACKCTNDRLSNTYPKPEWFGRFSLTLSRILGPLRAQELDEVLSLCRFGPGATTGTRGRGGVPSIKYDGEIHLTHELYPFSRSIMGERWWEHNRQPRIVVEGNKFTTVPKNAKTDRGICIEPQLNIYLQLGIGAFLRERARLFGLDLNTQTRNQDLARRAWKEGLATIDLSQASDSMSLGLIFHSLIGRYGEAWQHLLFTSRSPATFLEGKLVHLEKLSSMGNGYTFELESIVFFALARTIVPKEDWDLISVYGDDIIVPQYAAEEMSSALKFLGFRVNGAKSYLAGNFFESCGTDWFQGFNVRPFYLKGEKDSIPYPLSIANALRLYASRRLGGMGCDGRFHRLYRWLVKRVPNKWRRCKVPSHLGDVGLISSFLEARGGSYEHLQSGRLSPAPGQVEGWRIKAMSAHPYRKDRRTGGVLLAALQGHSCVDKWDPNPLMWGRDSLWTQGREPARGLMGAAKTRLVTVDRWPDGFDWIG